LCVLSFPEMKGTNSSRIFGGVLVARVTKKAVHT
jgi:hypothetical protein